MGRDFKRSKYYDTNILLSAIKDQVLNRLAHDGGFCGLARSQLFIVRGNINGNQCNHAAISEGVRQCQAYSGF